MGIQKNAIRGKRVLGVGTAFLVSFLFSHSRPVEAAPSVESWGTVVEVDSSSMVIETSGANPAARFVLKSAERNEFGDFLKKGDRVKIRYSMELKRVEWVEGEDGGEVSPSSIIPLRLDDRAFFET